MASVSSQMPITSSTAPMATVRPHCPLLFPPLARPCGNGSLTPQRTSEPSYSSMRGHPLPPLPRLRVVPFLGLAVVHRPGALGAAWSMWSTTDMHLKWTVRGAADSWVHGGSKEVPPYYAENNDSSTGQQGPTGRDTVLHKKNVSPQLL